MMEYILSRWDKMKEVVDRNGISKELAAGIGITDLYGRYLYRKKGNLIKSRIGNINSVWYSFWSDNIHLELILGFAHQNNFVYTVKMIINKTGSIDFQYDRRTPPLDHSKTPEIINVSCGKEIIELLREDRVIRDEYISSIQDTGK